MKGWHIGVLVVMCVVFAVGVLILCFLIYRFWGGVGSDSRREEIEDNKYRSTHIEHVEDAQGNDIVHISDGYHFARYDLKHSDHVLYYLDYQRNAKMVDFKKERAIVSGSDLQSYLSRAEGMDDPETISLAYVNARNALVEMDLDLLVRRDDNFGKRMRHTADRPLLLGRLTELVLGGQDGAVAPAAAAATPARDAGLYNPFATARGVNVQVDLGQNVQGHALMPPPQPATSPAATVMPPSSLYRSSPTVYGDSAAHPSRRAVTGEDPASVFSENPASAVDGSAAMRLGEESAPTPIIFPSATARVTTRTPVFILAADYVLSAARLTTPGRAVPTVDEQTTKALERAMAGELERTFYLDSGVFVHYTATVDPSRGTAILQHPSGTRYEFVRRAAPVIKYSIDRTTSSQWAVFTGPFYLPPGRWCVRAKACAADDAAPSAAIAKVYTVNVV